MNEQTDEQIEPAKLALERDKLQFERDKFFAEEEKRKAEVEQLKSDTLKSETERKKILIETQELEKPWYKRAAFLTSLSLPLTIVTLVTGTLGYLASRDTRVLQLEKASLSSQILLLSSQMSGIKEETNLAQMRFTKAEEESKSWQTQNAAANQTYKQALQKQDSLNIVIKQETLRIKLLQDQLVTGNMREFIRLVQQASANSNELAIGSYLDQIKSELRVGSPDLISRKRRFLEQEADDPRKPSQVRELLHNTLAAATRSTP